jgi:hypothetical protein
MAGCGAYRVLASVMDSESIKNIKVGAIAIPLVLVVVLSV